jgi:hypothetical protein
MSAKTSTAALDSFLIMPAPSLRRIPRHPAGAIALPCSAGFQASVLGSQATRFSMPFAVHQEALMNSRFMNPASRDIRTVLPVIVRVTLSLILWTLGAASMDLTAAQTSGHRVVKTFPADRAKLESLQRWVNAGHDTWCRDPRMVATETLRRVSPEFTAYEPASISLELERSHKTTAVYTLHSIDGRTTCRIVLRRHHWLVPVAGSLPQSIWVPERAEIITRDTLPASAPR